MAQPSSSVLQKRLEKVQINPAYVRETGSEIGRGAYGVVVELEAYGIRCAGKRLHDVLCRADEVNEKILNDFVSEVLRMRRLRHPNIVQFLGIVCDDTSVTLVMEHIPTTLSQCLGDKKYCDPNPGIPSFIKNSILLDIAQGLLFLHCQTPAIIHRDLSSNNVLITSAWQAKICNLGVAMATRGDFGQRTMLEVPTANDSQPSMSLLPGTELFMPPECHKPTKHGKVVYGPKLDCFSFGNLIIMVVLQVGWLESTLLSDVPDDETSKGQTEVKRRFYFLSQMEDHPLQGLAAQCLLDDPDQRPSADDIVRTLKEVVSDNPPLFANTLDLYHELIRTKQQENEYQRREKEYQRREKEYQRKEKEYQRKEKEYQRREKEYQRKLKDLSVEVQELSSKLRELTENLQSKKRMMQSAKSVAQDYENVDHDHTMTTGHEDELGTTDYENVDHDHLMTTGREHELGTTDYENVDHDHMMTTGHEHKPRTAENLHSRNLQVGQHTQPTSHGTPQSASPIPPVVPRHRRRLQSHPVPKIPKPKHVLAPTGNCHGSSDTIAGPDAPKPIPRRRTLKTRSMDAATS